MDNHDEKNREKICPECGCPLTTDGAERCSECGCPIPVTFDSDSEKPNGDEEIKNIQNAINTIGSYKTWEAVGEPGKSTIIVILGIIGSLLFLCSVILGIVGFIHLMVTSSGMSEIETYYAFRLNTMRYCVWIGISSAFGVLFGEICGYQEIKQCALWLNSKGVDTSSGNDLAQYKGAKRRKAAELVKNLYVVYYAQHPEELKNHAIATLVICIISFVSFIAGGICAGFGINQFLLGTDRMNWAVAIGCTAGGVLLFYVNKISRYVFRRIMVPRAEKWFAESKAHN